MIEWLKVIKRHIVAVVHKVQVAYRVRRLRTRLVQLNTTVKSEQPTRRIVLITLIEHLGDIVACEPIAREVRARYPNDYLVWMVRQRYRELLDYNPFIDAILTVECITEWINIRSERLYDVAIELHLRDHECWICKVPLTKESGEISMANYFHFGALLPVFSQSAGLPPLTDPPRLYVPKQVAERVSALHLPKPFIALHAVSNEKTKDWQRAKWAELVEKIETAYETCTVEVGHASVLPKRHRRFNYCKRLSILETAELIRRAVLFIGIDSGPAHLANAVETFGIILLGKHRDFQRYMPYTGGYADGTNADLIYSSTAPADIAVERVFRAVERRLNVALKPHLSNS